MHKLLFMGSAEHVDDVRCRVYGGEDPHHEQRLAFLRACAGPGAVDCEAYDGFVAALKNRGWLPSEPDLEPNPNGPGKIGRWRLTETGRMEAAEFLTD